MAFRIGPTPAPPPRFKKPPGGTTTPPKTLFEQLLPVTWRDVAFPISDMSVQLSQDLVQHKYWGIDAANVEATGRAPMEITATIPFYNGIVPGKNEKWGVLYPTVFRQFLDAFSDKSTGVLNHPELGEITCKPVSLDFKIDAQRRDGVEATAKWIETRLDLDDGKVGVGQSPIEAADLAALDLDASKTDLLALLPDAEFKDFTFDDMVNKLSGFFDQVSITSHLLAAKPGQLFARVKSLQNSAERARDVTLWPVIFACDRMLEVCAPKKKAGKELFEAPPTANSRKISRYTTQTTMTLAGLGQVLGNSLSELLGLNPQLLSRPDVASGVVVRHYGEPVTTAVATKKPNIVFSKTGAAGSPNDFNVRA